MLRRSVGAIIGLMVAVGVLAAQQAKDKDAKGGKEITAKVVKVDADKMVVTVTLEDGKKKDLKIGEDTKIVGPRGGVSTERLKDDRLKVGAEIKVTMSADGKTVKQIQLPIRTKTPDKKDK
jgi:hypothetical protein